MRFEEIWRQDGMALIEMQDGQPVPTSKIHFGYTDGITMPTIRGGPEQYAPITSGPASHGSSFYEKTPRTTTCRNHDNSG